MSSTTPVSTGSVARWVVITAVVGTILIALGAFSLSFTALSNLTALSGIPVAEAWIWPLTVDGIIVVATVSVVALRPHGRRATLYPWGLLFAGALVSVAANTAHALVAVESSVPRLLAAAVSAVPPVVLLAMTHLTVELTRRTNIASDLDTVADVPLDALAATGDADPRDRSRRDAATSLRGAGWSNRMIAHSLGVHPSTVGRWLPAALATKADPSPTIRNEQKEPRHDR